MLARNKLDFVIGGNGFPKRFDVRNGAICPLTVPVKNSQSIIEIQFWILDFGFWVFILVADG